MDNDMEFKTKLRKLGKTWEEMVVEDRLEADNYYNQKIMPLLIKKFANDENKINKGYDYGIFIVGNFYQRTVLSFFSINPSEAVFLVTEETKSNLDKIIELTGLSFSKCEMLLVRKDCSSDVYKAIKEFYEKKGQAQNLAIDITGGTTIMSTGTAMSGALIGADLFYIAADEYFLSSRVPKPGTERLIKINNPYQVFGDLEKKKIFALYNSHDYSAAATKLLELVEKVPDPRKYQILRHISKAYESWDRFNLKFAIKNLELAIKKIGQYSLYLQYEIKLKNQLNALHKLFNFINYSTNNFENLKNKEGISNLIFTLYHAASRNEQKERCDIAALLWYRILELMGQRRLAVHNIDSSASQLSEQEKEELLIELNNFISKQKKLKEFTAFPYKISCIDSYLLLAVLGDSITDDIIWSKLAGTTEARNRSIFAHGFKFISKENSYQAFKEVVLARLDKFCEIEGIDKEGMIEVLRFIKLF